MSQSADLEEVYEAPQASATLCSRRKDKRAEGRRRSSFGRMRERLAAQDEESLGDKLIPVAYSGPKGSLLSVAAKRISLMTMKRMLPKCAPNARNRLASSDRSVRSRHYGFRAVEYQPAQLVLEAVQIPFTTPQGETHMLAAFVRRPNRNDRYPTVILRTPYGKDSQNEWSKTLSERGYVVVAVDCRGREGSQGSFFPIETEIADAEAVIEWVTQQPWYNGKIGVHGESYNGFCAYSAIGGKHADKITCLAPAITSSRLYSIIYDVSGAMNWELAIRWLWLVIGRMNKKDASIKHKLSTVYHFWLCKHSTILEKAFLHLPAEDVDKEYVGLEMDIWRNGLRSPEEDAPFWEGKDRLCDLRKGCPPLHLFGGWYDFFLPGTLQDYQDAVGSGSEVLLTIGDYSHWEFNVWGKQQFPGTLDFYDSKLKSLPSAPRKPVRCQLQGSQDSFEMDTFPPKSLPLPFFFGQDRTLLNIAHDPALLRTRTSLKYVYDPSNPTPAVGGTSFAPRNSGRMRQAALEVREDLLVFTSETSTEDLLIVGAPRATIFVRSELEHFDIVVRLCVVRDGHSYNICDGMSRQGVYGGKQYSQAELLPDGVQRVTVTLGACAFRLQEGEKLRAHICSGAHPRWMRNYGTGEDLATSTRLTSNHIEVLCGGDCMSQIELPMVNVDTA